MAQMNLFTEQTHRQKTVLGGGRERTENLGLADVNYYIRMNKQQGPTDNTGNYIQHPVINHNGKENEKECTAEINTTLHINHALVQLFPGECTAHRCHQGPRVCFSLVSFFIVQVLSHRVGVSTVLIYVKSLVQFLVCGKCLSKCSWNHEAYKVWYPSERWIRNVFLCQETEISIIIFNGCMMR